MSCACVDGGRAQRKALFRPLLEPITELESSACET